MLVTFPYCPEYYPLISFSSVILRHFPTKIMFPISKINFQHKATPSKSKAVPLHAMEAHEGTGGIAPTHT
jgi:hypothetical protein